MQLIYFCCHDSPVKAKNSRIILERRLIGVLSAHNVVQTTKTRHYLHLPTSSTTSHGSPTASSLLSHFPLWPYPSGTGTGWPLSRFAITLFDKSHWQALTPASLVLTHSSTRCPSTLVLSISHISKATLTAYIFWLSPSFAHKYYILFSTKLAPSQALHNQGRGIRKPSVLLFILKHYHFQSISQTPFTSRHGFYWIECSWNED